jgi:hypothetical protein
MTEEDVLGGLLGIMPYLRFRWFYLAVIVAGAVFGVASGGLMKEPLSYAPFLGVNGFLLVLAFFGPRIAARKTVRALRLDEGDVTFRFDADGISTHAPGSTATVAYRAIPGWRESASAFLLTCGPNAANIIPKRAFEPGDVDRVRALLAANVTAAPLIPRKKIRRTLILWVALIFAFLVIWHLFNDPQNVRPPRARPASSEPAP